MRSIDVTPQIKQIILFDHYDETFWNGILEEFKIDLINGKNFFIRLFASPCFTKNISRFLKFSFRCRWTYFCLRYLIDKPNCKYY